MINLLRSEVLKFRTVRLHVWLTIGAVGLLLVVVGLVGMLSSEPRRTRPDDLMSLIGGFSVLIAMTVGVLAALGITSEFSHNTIRPTLAATPQRTTVFVAKAVLSTVYGLVVGAVAVVAAYLLGSLLLSARGASVGLSGDDGSLAAFLGVPILCALLALFGYGLGLLLRNSPAAVSLIILWPLLLESILNGVLSVAGVDEPTRLLPYTSAFALVIPNPSDAPGGRIYGGVYFGMFALLITVIGIAVNNRRDA
ncbi:MAG: ABC transporter permease subunit [Ilumatobacter sp.]|nr:ABC transporter permease subunit [Ilumatobacter sp.]